MFYGLWLRRACGSLPLKISRFGFEKWSFDLLCGRTLAGSDWQMFVQREFAFKNIFYGFSGKKSSSSMSHHLPSTDHRRHRQQSKNNPHFNNALLLLKTNKFGFIVFDMKDGWVKQHHWRSPFALAWRKIYGSLNELTINTTPWTLYLLKLRLKLRHNGCLLSWKQ